MKSPLNLTDRQSAWDALIFFLLAALLIFAPLIFGGNHPLPLLVLELMSLPLLAYAVWKPAFLTHLNKSFLIALGLLFVFPLLQWLPLLPAALWQILPGREPYAAAVSTFGTETGWLRPLSLVPAETEDAWLAMLPPLAVFLVAIGLNEKNLKRMVFVFLAMAAFQAMLGLAQFGGGLKTDFRLNPGDIGLALGTYVNRNHLAGLLEMALPIGLGMLVSRIGSGGMDERYGGRGWMRRLRQFVMRLPRPNQTMLFAAVVVLLVLGLIFSRSRSGIMLGMLGIFLSSLLYGRHIGGVRSNSLATLIAAIGLALAAVIGLAPVMERFSMEDALADARWQIYATSLSVAWDFFPFGSGLGTFADVFIGYQPEFISKFVNYTHNDYIQFIFEAGLVAVVVILMFLVLYAMRWPALLRGVSWDTLSFMQVGAGIGLLLMGLHGLTDFNLHIPANAMYFALLAAVFFHRREQHHRNHRRSGQSRTEPKPEIPAVVAPNFPVVRGERGNNPFAE